MNAAFAPMPYDAPDAVQVSSMPHNLEAEQALLGSLMFDNAVFERLSDRLRGSHFYEPFHQRLFDAIEDHIRQGLLAEPTILMERFKQDPAFQEFGGLRYLADLVDRAPPAANAPDYARVVYDLALRRDLIRIGGEIIKEAPNPETPADEQIEQAEQTLYSLAETGKPSSGFVSFSHALSGAVEMAGEAYQREGKLAGLATRLDDLDQKLGGLHPSDLLILAGRPSMGKTALATNIAFNVARNYRWEPTPDGGRKTVDGGVVAFYSLEMSAEQLAMRILADASGVSSDKLRKGEIDASDFGKIRDAAIEIGESPLYIDATGGLSISKLAARARRLKRMEHGLDLIVVDYLQLVTTGENSQKNRVQEVSEITGGLKALAKELNVPIIALSQLSRQVEQREDKRPQLSDLRESGSIEQDADCVMFVYRESYYLGRAEPREGTEEHLKWQEDMDRLQHQAEVVIGKQRHGPIGIVKLAFDSNTTRFGNLAHDGRYGGAYADIPE
ncbi:MAG: replicative DNA helicase [Brevundimonas diminuta]|uniref:replicative DNA helicase n=1 Tax=Brevundimonas diminuta TaxID=293 RepID=UPI00059081E2|nr:replicative DNA helicase [Brevundimonas diminuta]MBI2248397.1 replicative DNA helicase [Brevundimonas diminuta]MCZ4107528.1 replicative DNA helicase [Brevundimonas diminuta]OWR24356.1 replicative DNA helicase [Brevundimonas diminuta]OYX20419.1 MAG: replicative DNA helicase [Brevundimonas diminuta]WQE46210.1 replicative DNA helicase [Brevundimonas diminuta]